MSYLKKAVTRITLDLSMPDVQKSITCTRGDRNRLMEIVVTNEGKPFHLPPRWSALLFGTKPDGTMLVNGCVVEEGRIVYDFESGDQIATCAGRYAVTVWIHDEEGVPVAAPKIWVNVIESGAQQIVESDNQFNELLEHAAQILALQEKDKTVDAEIDGLKAKDAQVDEEISGLKEKDVQVDEEITNLKLFDMDARHQIQTLKEKDAQVDEEIIGLKAKDAQVDGEIIGLKAKDAQVDGELETLRAKLKNVVSSKVITIDPSRWTDGLPLEASIGIEVPKGSERRSTVLLIPKNKVTRDESQAIELAVNTSWTADQIMTIWVYMTRQDTNPPTIPLSYLALVVYDEEAPADSTSTAEFVGVVNLPDKLMEREVKRVLETLGVTEDALPTAIDLSRMDEGEIVETFSDGTTKTTTIEYDADGNPVKITDDDGNVTVLTW